MEEGYIEISFSRPRVTPEFYAPLFRAILEDNWKGAKFFILNDLTNCLGAAITKDQGTALHFAAAAKCTYLVEKLVKLMVPKELELKNNKNCTALCIAAKSEIVKIAWMMVEKNNNLPLIPKDDIQALPLHAAIETGNRDMVSYLYSVTPILDLASADRIKLLNTAISNDLYDTALKILDTLKLTTEEKEHLWEPLEMLSRKPSEIIGNKSQPSVWERCLNSVFKGWFCNKSMMQASAHRLVDLLWRELLKGDSFSSTHDHMLQHHKELVVEATKVGNVEFLIILVSTYPDLIWQVDEEYGTLFHVAVQHRQVRVFNLIYEISGLKYNLASYLSKGRNNMLHLAGDMPLSYPLNKVTGQEALLQMQQELWWFQEIEKIVPKSFVNQPNEREETPRDIYVRTHKKLQKNGEKWMKDKANSCMLVATLIITLAFSAAFTVPLGNNQETGFPIFLECNWLTVFFLSDIVAMIFSSSSMLVFLSIFYSEKDFFKSLPYMMALGVVMLSTSIVGILTAFITACFLVFKLNTIASIGFIGGTCLIVYWPFKFYVKLYYELLYGILRSLYYSRGFLFRSQKRLFKVCKLARCKLARERMTCLEISQYEI